METTHTSIDNIRFQDDDQESGQILSSWLERSGIDRRKILEEIHYSNKNLEPFGHKSFQQWTTYGVSSHRISGHTAEILGERLVAIVNWFIKEHFHRSKSVIKLQELKRLRDLYPDISTKSKLQLARLINYFDLETNPRSLNDYFINDWRRSLEKWPSFAFVTDQYWCIRASSHYEMALVGHKEKDLLNWGWWHRLISTRNGKKKFEENSAMRTLRGPYADAYYRWQMMRFIADTESFRKKNDWRYNHLMSLLNQTPRFEQIWKECREYDERVLSGQVSIPVPFYREDGTLLWMLEVSSLIPDTDNYRLILWTPLNAITDEYLAEIRRWADESGQFSKKAYFLKDYQDFFTKEQKLALGLS
jgi:hypothetical protein